VVAGEGGRLARLAQPAGKAACAAWPRSARGFVGVCARRVIHLWACVARRVHAVPPAALPISAHCAAPGVALPRLVGVAAWRYAAPLIARVRQLEAPQRAAPREPTAR